MKVHLKGGRFGSKTLDQMFAEVHLRALIDSLHDRGVLVTAGADPGVADAEVHIEAQNSSSARDVPKICVQLENRFIWPANTTQTLNAYDHLVTWDRSRQGEGVTHIFPPVEKREWRTRKFAQREALAAIVATNRAENTSSPNELYSERVRIIKFFEARPDLKFELWGRGWNLPPQPRGLVFSAVYKLLRRIPVDLAGLRNYQGSCESKDDVLERAVFNFCFENVSGLKGYVTEKIFDSLIAGCVPIYDGCEDIDLYVPPDCYIRYDSKRDTSDLVDQLTNFSEDDYDAYDAARREFLSSAEFEEHSIGAFGATTARAIVDFVSSPKCSAV